MSIPRKRAPQPSPGITVTHRGPDDAFAPVFLYADVLEELAFHASRRRAFGLLSGCGYLYPLAPPTPDKDSATPADASSDPDIPDYVEVTAFRDIFPCEDALDYAGYLRRIHEFRDVRGDVVGVVCLVPEPRHFVYEDLLMFRTYFADPWKIFLMVFGNGTAPAAFRMAGNEVVPVQVGYNLIGAEEDEPTNDEPTEAEEDEPTDDEPTNDEPTNDEPTNDEDDKSKDSAESKPTE